MLSKRRVMGMWSGLTDPGCMEYEKCGSLDLYSHHYDFIERCHLSRGFRQSNGFISEFLRHSDGYHQFIGKFRGKFRTVDRRLDRRRHRECKFFEISHVNFGFSQYLVR